MIADEAQETRPVEAARPDRVFARLQQGAAEAELAAVRRDVELAESVFRPGGEAQGSVPYAIGGHRRHGKRLTRLDEERLVR